MCQPKDAWQAVLSRRSETVGEYTVNMAQAPPPPASRPAASAGPSPTSHQGSSRGFAAFTLPDTSIASLAKMWRMLDDDCDGLLHPDQLRTMIAAVGIPPTKQLVAGIVKCTPDEWRHVGVDIDTVGAAFEPLRRTNACHCTRRCDRPCFAVSRVLRDVPWQRAVEHGCYRGSV